MLVSLFNAHALDCAAARAFAFVCCPRVSVIEIPWAMVGLRPPPIPAGAL